MSAKDISTLVRRLKKQGWRVEIAGSGHWLCTNPEGERMTCSMSPSDYYAYRNARSDARRLGARV